MMQMTLYRAQAAIALTMVLAAGSAQAQERIANHNFWAAFAQDTDKGKVCWIASAPVGTDSADGVGGREGAFLMVSYRPGEDIVDGEVSVVAGYDYQAGAKATVEVDGGKDYSFFTAGDGAWLEEPGDEKGLIAAMRRGSFAKVRGTDTDTTKITDDFNLKGFTAASGAARKACGL